VVKCLVENQFFEIFDYTSFLLSFLEWSREEDAALPVAEVMVGIKLRH
jgi:hypothetical protein